MLQYIWVNNHKIIKQQGFNLLPNRKFEFVFKEIQAENGEIEINGRLIYNEIDTPQFFASEFSNMTLIIGSNGSGKSTLIDEIISSIMINTPRRFDGIIVFDKCIFVPNNYNIEELQDYKIIKHIDLVNYKRKIHNSGHTSWTKPLVDEINAVSMPGQIASTYLSNTSTIYYSSCFNLDNIYSSFGLAGSTERWETDYNHLVDISTENLIVRDFKSFDKSYSDRVLLTGKSELLSHKSQEAIRILSFLNSHISLSLPFSLAIGYGYLDFNHAYKESLEKHLRTKNEYSFWDLEQRLEKKKDTKNNNSFEHEFYLSFLYGAILKELGEILESTFDSSALEQVMDSLNKLAEKGKTTKEILIAFLKQAKFLVNGISCEKITFNINNLFFYLSNDKAFIKHSKGGCIVDIKKLDIEKWKKTTYENFTEDYRIDYLFDVFSLNFSGLSSGEKSLLSFFGRIYSYITLQLKQNYLGTKEFVFFIDELDNNLHPAWQIKLLDMLHNILPQLLPDRKLQLIITTHSPILVSDFPKNNIIFLDKDKDGYCRVVDPMTRENTFGANIQTLYRNSFFLNGLPIGEFAKKKINKLFNELEQNKIRATTFQEIQLIGEPILKNQLMKIYKQHKDLPQSVDKRITELEEEVRILKDRLNDKN